MKFKMLLFVCSLYALNVQTPERGEERTLLTQAEISAKDPINSKAVSSSIPARNSQKSMKPLTVGNSIPIYEEDAVITKEKADRDTLTYENGAQGYWPTDDKYFWVEFDIKKIRPAYDPAESTFVLTGVTFAVHKPQARVCTLTVYDKYYSAVYKTAYQMSRNKDSILWFEIPVPSIALYDTFAVVLYIPTSPSNHSLPCVNTSQPDFMSGVIRDNSWYYLTNADICIRAIGHFTQVHDVGLWEINFPSHPYIISQQENLNYYASNFGNYNESDVPVTVYLGSEDYYQNLSINRKSYTPIAFEFTPSREELFRAGGYTNLTGDAVVSNDTFPQYNFYFFPKYTCEDFALDFEAMNSFPPTGWITYDLDRDGNTWAWYVGLKESHSGWYFTGSYYNAEGNNDWLVSPPITTYDTCNNSFGFWARSLSGDRPEHLIVYLMSLQNPADTIQKLLDVPSLPANWTRYTFSLDKYRGQNVYIGFRNASVDKYYLLLDDFFVRQLPLRENEILSEEFEEVLTPPGWSVSGTLWQGGNYQEANVPDNGTGNIYFFKSSEASGSTSELISPLVKFVNQNPNPYLNFRFNYYNSDGNDSMNISYRFSEAETWIHYATFTTSSGWTDITGGPIYSPSEKEVSYLQIKITGYSDAGTSNIAIDNFTVFNGPILNIPDESAAKFKLNTISKGISLEITNIKNSVKVDIYDALGRRVRNTEIRSTGSYNINGLEPGIYFVILSRDINYRGKVLIVK